MLIFLIILGVLLLLFGFFTEELYRYIFCKKSSRLFTKLFDKKGHEEGYYRFRDEAARRLAETPAKTYTIENRRHQKLKGFYYPCGANGKKIVFLVHGYRSDHLDTGGMFYDYYKSRGIDFFCPDHTAAGESEGHFIGFDVLETEDSLLWIDFLRDTFGKDTELILHGFSMGAATVLQMSSHCPANVKCIVADSGYTNAKASMLPQIGPMYYLLRPLNRLIARYDWNASDVRESLSHATVPILFVHGKDDKLVPFSCGPQLFQFYKGEKDCLFREHTRHIETMYTSPALYCEKLDALIEKYMGK